MNKELEDYLSEIEEYRSIQKLRNSSFHDSNYVIKALCKCIEQRDQYIETLDSVDFRYRESKYKDDDQLLLILKGEA